mgnify:FL=1
MESLITCKKEPDAIFFYKIELLHDGLLLEEAFPCGYTSFEDPHPIRRAAWKVIEEIFTRLML